MPMIIMNIKLLDYINNHNHKLQFNIVTESVTYNETGF